METQCRPGSYAVTANTEACSYCEAGKYQPAFGSSSCLSCAPGHYCPPGSSTPVPCPAGTHTESSGSSVAGDCSSCPAVRPDTFELGVRDPSLSLILLAVCRVRSVRRGPRRRRSVFPAPTRRQMGSRLAACAMKVVQQAPLAAHHAPSARQDPSRHQKAESRARCASLATTRLTPERPHALRALSAKLPPLLGPFHVRLAFLANISQIKVNRRANCVCWAQLNQNLRQ